MSQTVNNPLVVGIEEIRASWGWFLLLGIALIILPRPENLWVSLWLGGQSNMRRNACWRGFRDGTRHSSASPFFRSQFFSTDNGLRCGV